MGEMTFEQAVTQLEELVEQMEKGELTLEQALIAHREAIGLIDFCQRCLDRAEKQMRLVTEAGGRISLVPWEGEELDD